MIINTAEDLRDYVLTVGNILGKNLIKVWLKDPTFQNAQGIYAMKYRKKRKDGGSVIGITTAPHDYNARVVAGTACFMEDPFPGNTRPLGIGTVMYLLDDEEPVPEGALGGKEKGWNREFLASHYYEDLMIIEDEKVRAEVEKRAKRIQKTIAERKKAMAEVEAALEGGIAQKDKPELSNLTPEQIEAEVNRRVLLVIADKIKTQQISDTTEPGEDGDDEDIEVKEEELEGAIAGD